MTGRLTPEWTDTLDEAFGESGKKGRLGEQFVADTLRSWGYEVYTHDNSRSHQLSGIDITFKKSNWFKSYTADVKHNINDNNSFQVDVSEDGWLFNAGKVSDRIWHCNVDKGLMAWYGRPEMKAYVKNLNLENTSFISVSPYGVYNNHTRIGESPSFIVFRRISNQPSDK